MVPDALKEPIRTSAEEARNFIDLFYNALNNCKPISSFYVNNNNAYRTAGHKPADICINGLVIATPEEYDTMLASQRATDPAFQPPTTGTAPPTGGGGAPPRPYAPSPVRHNPVSLDVHVLNPDFRFGAPAELLAPNPNKPAHGAGVRIMLLACVSGTVVLGTDAKFQEKKHFSDNFILVPNWDAIAKHGSKATRRFLIASHQYRCD